MHHAQRCHRLVPTLVAFVLIFVLAACRADGADGSPQPNPTVATFGTANFDDAQFE